VLDLCKHYLHTLNSATCSHSDNESDCGSDEGVISFAPEPNLLIKCLELMMCFLDVYVKHLPSVVIREGWSIMAEILKSICLQGKLNYLFFSFFFSLIITSNVVMYVYTYVRVI